MASSPPGSSVTGMYQARILQWVSISFPEDLPNPGIEPTYLVSPALAGGCFTIELPGKPDFDNQAVLYFLGLKKNGMYEL